MMNKTILIILVIAVFLLITPINAKTVTAKVDDKGLIYVNSYGIAGTLHTPYGWICVDDNDYNQIQVNDTIIYDTNKNTMWTMFWEVTVV